MTRPQGSGVGRTPGWRPGRSREEVVWTGQRWESMRKHTWKPAGLQQHCFTSRAHKHKACSDIGRSSQSIVFAASACTPRAE